VKQITKAVFFVFLLLLTLIPITAQDDDRASTVIFEITSGRVTNPESFNPYIQSAPQDQGLRQAMMEPIFILNYESGELMSWLGDSWEQNEAADVWTITLREGVTWSDGEVLDADDLAFTANMILENEGLYLTGGITSSVASVEKIDDLTVQFNLNGSNPRFIIDNLAGKNGFSQLYIVPEHIWADQDPTTFTNYDPEQGWPVFSGAYLVDTATEAEFVYVRNDAWWGAESGWMDLPAPERLIWTAYGSEDTRVSAISNDELDSVNDISLGSFFVLQSNNPNAQAYYSDLPYAWPDPCARNIEFNTTVAPWDDAEMRLALNAAINRDEIVAIAYEGGTQASSFIYPEYSGMESYLGLLAENDLAINAYDPDAARATFEAKGYTLNGDYYEKDGEQLAINIQTPDILAENQAIADVVVAQWQAVGVNATWGNVAYGTFWDNFFTGNFEARSGWQTCGSVNEPWDSLDTLSNRHVVEVGERAGRNAWRWDNQEYSDLVAEIGVLPLGDEAIDPLFVEAAGIFLSELPVIPVTQAKKLIPFNTTYWTNWPTAENNYIQPAAWWQSTHVIIHNLEPVQ